MNKTGGASFMGKKEKEKEIKDAEKELKMYQEKYEQAQNTLINIKSNIDEAQKKLDWVRRSPIDRARASAVEALHFAMTVDRKNGTETYQEVINALEEKTPESKLAVALSVVFGAIVPDKEED
jgi:chromosome segregation ATPase